MFAKIIGWIKEVFSKMIGSQTVKEALKIDVAVSPVMAEALQLWADLYENNAPWLSDDIKSLNLPAAIAGEIARAATIEMQVEFTGSARSDFLKAEFASVQAKLREQVEKGCAKGGLMMKPYIRGKRIGVDFVQADMFYPVEFDGDGDIVACIFADQKTRGDKHYTRLEYHHMEDGGCVIENRAFKSDNANTLGREIALTEVEDWADLLPVGTIYDIDKPLFAYFRYPLANNIDPTSPLGMSCYSRAVDLIEQADRLFSNLIWEFKSGKRKMVVSPDALTKNPDTGAYIYPTDEDRNLYRMLNGFADGNIGDPTKLFEAWSPDFREASILSGLDALLKRIEFTAGLAYGTLSDPQNVDKTATEIQASKQRSAATVADTQKALEEALDRLLYAMDMWATLGNLAPKGAYQVTFEFDDSLIVDSEAQFKQDTQLVGMGIMSKVEFRVRNLGEKEEVAREKIKAVQAEQPQDMFGEERA